MATNIMRGHRTEVQFPDYSIHLLNIVLKLMEGFLGISGEKPNLRKATEEIDRTELI